MEEDDYKYPDHEECPDDEFDLMDDDWFEDWWERGRD